MTSDERTWKFDRPVIFLGEWCKRHDREHIWSKMDAIVAEPYGIKSDEKKISRRLVVSIYKELINELSQSMNQFHAVRHSTRYWEILLGPWLLFYIRLIMNRYGTLVSVLNNYEISGVTAIDTELYTLPKKDFSSFILAVDDSFWNLALYSKILKHIDPGKININYLNISTDRLISNNINSKNTKDYVRCILRKLLSVFVRRNDAFIIQSYLPRKAELLLQFVLGQVPQLWKSPDLIEKQVDHKLRSTLKINYSKHSDFSLFVRKLVFDLIPVCYLEGYESLLDQACELNWPIKPKFIFTSNSFFIDEVFKAWLCDKIQNGVPYYTGQHGANYGTLEGFDVWSECSTCDKFFSWGWSLPLPSGKVIPAFNFKIISSKIQKKINDGDLLLIERGPGRRDGPQDKSYEHKLYQDYVFRFFRGLSSFIQHSVLVRLHRGSSELDASDEILWKKNFPDVRIDLGGAPINKLTRQSRLVVHTYESAGILETLALNIPTIAFWREGLDHLLPSAKPYYELLVKVGVIAQSPESAAEHVVLSWDDIGEWWYSTQVQEARIKFCDQYSRVVDKPVMTLRKLLTY